MKQINMILSALWMIILLLGLFGVVEMTDAQITRASIWVMGFMILAGIDEVIEKIKNKNK